MLSLAVVVLDVPMRNEHFVFWFIITYVHYTEETKICNIQNKIIISFFMSGK